MNPSQKSELIAYLRSLNTPEALAWVAKLTKKRGPASKAGEVQAAWRKLDDSLSRYRRAHLVAEELGCHVNTVYRHCKELS